ncbi:MAG TPA: hypothetical protein PK256_15370, partial [Verrucomicrobiota bacterium]|nr:hypothetical protein [Verrucomicrobiota bacterium]
IVPISARGMVVFPELDLGVDRMPECVPCCEQDVGCRPYWRGRLFTGPRGSVWGNHLQHISRYEMKYGHASGQADR